MTEATRKENKIQVFKCWGVFPGEMQPEIYKEKHPGSFNGYMKVDYAVEKVTTNLKSENPELDLIIKRHDK